MASKTQIQDMLTKHKLTDPKLVADFLSLINPTGGVSSRPANIMHDNAEYYFCRNSGHYFLLENMVKDKNGKSKGYSSIGNSIYTQAQNHKKGLLKKIDQLKDEFIALDVKDKQYAKLTKELKTKMEDYQSTIDGGNYNDGLWMVETFLMNLKPERVMLFNKIAFTKDVLTVLETNKDEATKK